MSGNDTKKSDKGFALPELMAVLIIIAVLVSIAVPIFASSVQNARNRADEANVRILNSATLQWMMADEGNNPKAENTASLRGKLAGPYVQGWPVSPNGKSYVLVNGIWETN